MVAPSGMMDGMVAAIRNGLDDAGYQEMPIMSYAAKYESAFTGRSAMRRTAHRRSVIGDTTRWIPRTPARRCGRSASTPSRAPT